MGNPLEEFVNTGGKILEAGKDAVTAGVTIIAAPVIVADAVIKGKPVDEAIIDTGQKIIDAHKEAGRETAQASGVSANLQNKLLIDLGGAVAGDQGAKTVQYLVAGSEYQNNIVAAVPQILLKNGAPLNASELVVAPIASILAGALATSVEILERHAVPLPKIIRLSLSQFFTDSLLSKAKYWVGDFGITLPEIVNGYQKFMGNHEHAVTVGHIIVFSVEPGASNSDLHWWAHELQHVKQYEERGINQFALDYCHDASSLENDAEAAANMVSNAP